MEILRFPSDQATPPPQQQLGTEVWSDQNFHGLWLCEWKQSKNKASFLFSERWVEMVLMSCDLIFRSLFLYEIATGILKDMFWFSVVHFYMILVSKSAPETWQFPVSKIPRSLRYAQCTASGLALNKRWKTFPPVFPIIHFPSCFPNHMFFLSFPNIIRYIQTYISSIFLGGQNYEQKITNGCVENEVLSCWTWMSRC